MVEKLVQAKMPKIVGRKKDDISEKDEFSLPQIVSWNPSASSTSTKFGHHGFTSIYSDKDFLCYSLKKR